MRFRSVSSIASFGTSFGASLGASLGALLVTLLYPNVGRAADTDVRLNSAGYLPGYPKVATIVAGAEPATTFSLRREGQTTPDFEGKLSAVRTETATKEKLQFADFSAFNAPGDYYLDVPGVGRSTVFHVGPGSLDDAFRTVMLGFYGWRSGIDLKFDFHGVHYEQAAGHLQDALMDFVDPDQAGVIRDGKGGWYDAGDYGKYTVNGSFTLGMMLQAWEDFGPTLAKVELDIPEKGDARPDYLDELAYQYKWLFSMQLEDGQVSHKLDSKFFADFVAPADDRESRYFSKPSSVATAAFVAAMAKGYRAFKTHDPELADQMLTAAKKSWKWLLANPKSVAPKLKPDFNETQYVTGDATYRMWAATEMWESTGDAAALESFESLARCEKDKVDSEFDWGSAKDLAMLTYIRSQRTGRKPAFLNNARASLLNAANSNVKTRDASGYGRATSSYYWGSNGVVARTCLVLQSANAIAPDRRYVETCLDQVGHLLGRNYYDRSQVTGLGINPPLHPHHRPSSAAKLTFPGLLVGGSSTGATGWVDDESDYTSNEVAINWNGALVYALAGFISGSSAPTLDGGVSPADAGALPRDASVPRDATMPPPVDGGVRPADGSSTPQDADARPTSTDAPLPSIESATEDQSGCVAPKPTYSTDVSGPPSLIDDLEDGDQKINETEGRTGSWFSFDDGTGSSSMSVKKVGRADGAKSIYVSGAGYTGWGGGIGMTLNATSDATKKLYDASKYTGITFWAKGSADSEFRVMIPEARSDEAGGICGGCNDHPTVAFTGTGDWKQYTFTWGDFVQLGFGDELGGIDPKRLYAIQFQWGRTETPFELWVDDVSFTSAKATPDAGKVDAAKDSRTSVPSTDNDDGESVVDEEEPSFKKTTSNGCGCQVPGQTTSGTYGLAAAAAALTLINRKRRSTRR